MRTQDLYVLFVDLDGVLADLDRFMMERIGRTWNDTRPHDDEVWKDLQRIQALGEPVFEVLEFMPDAMELWSAIQGFKPHILTATGDDYHLVAPEKVRWVKKHLPNHGEIITVQSSSHKARYARSNRILIDDRMKSIGPWREAGGIGILHTNAQTTLDQLSQLGFRFPH